MGVKDAHDTLVALGVPGGSSHRRIVEGVKLEIIEVLDPGAAAGDLDDKNRLFVGGTGTSPVYRLSLRVGAPQPYAKGAGRTHVISLGSKPSR